MARPRKLPTPGDPSIAIGYVRVSGDKQEHGPKAQRDAIEAWARGAGVRVVAVYEETTSGGKKSGEDTEDALERRVALFGALADARTMNAGIIVVARRDRIGRDSTLIAVIEGEAQKRGARFVSAAGEGTADDAPGSTLMRSVIDAVGVYELAMIRMRTKAALVAKKRRGERTGGIPYGFRLAVDGVHLVAHPEEGRAVAFAVKLRADGLALAKIAAALDDTDFVPRGGERWHPQTVANILLSAQVKP